MTKILAFIIEGVNWLRIALSPTIIGFIFGGVFYLSQKTMFSKIIWAFSTLLGFALGAIWATKVWKKEGTTNHMAKLIATPELDYPSEDKKTEGKGDDDKKDEL